MLIRRATDVEITIRSNQFISVTANKKSETFPNNALTILQVFANPLSINDALKEMNITDRYEWIGITHTITRLLQAGVLTDASESKFVPDRNSAAFGAAPIHITMLNDRVRTDAFIKGIGEIVRAGDIVVDIGTGTGILAIAAARAGAKHVYAIEASGIADAAQDAISRTEVAGKITLIRGLSTQIELPEKADVLISEIIGNDPFGENILPVFKDAVERLLKQDARILPGQIKVFGLPVKVPAARLQNIVLQQHDLDNWKEWYKVDLQVLKDGTDLAQPLWKARAEKLTDFEILDEPVLLAEVQFTGSYEATISNQAEGAVQGTFNGMLLYFEVVLGDTFLSNHPLADERAWHWLNLVWYLPEAEKIAAGDKFKLQYDYSGKKSALRLIK